MITLRSRLGGLSIPFYIWDLPLQTAKAMWDAPTQLAWVIHRGVAWIIHRGVAWVIHRGVAWVIHRGVAWVIHGASFRRYPLCVWDKLYIYTRNPLSMQLHQSDHAMHYVLQHVKVIFSSYTNLGLLAAVPCMRVHNVTGNKYKFAQIGVSECYLLVSVRIILFNC